MKLLLLLGLCAAVAAAKIDIFENYKDFAVDPASDNEGARNIFINVLVRQLIAYLRFVINNGSSIFGIPPLDPLELEEFHLKLPAGLVNLDLHLKDVLVTGVGGFVVHTSNLRPSQLTFDIDISVPRLNISAGQYDLDGDLFTAIPLYGKGSAEFQVEGFRFRALLHLMQSEDGQSILINRIENPSFEIPVFRSNLDGAIGGGDIDAIVNAIIQEVLINYVNRFQGAISLVASQLLIQHGNPLLDQLDTWRYISPFV